MYPFPGCHSNKNTSLTLVHQASFFRWIRFRENRKKEKKIETGGIVRGPLPNPDNLCV